MGWCSLRSNPARQGRDNDISDLLGLHASAANLFSVGGAFVNPESAYYFDWHAQIDNPVSVLKGAIAHLQRGHDWNETAVNALRDALSIVVDEWYK